MIFNNAFKQLALKRADRNLLTIFSISERFPDALIIAERSVSVIGSGVGGEGAISAKDLNSTCGCEATDKAIYHP